VARSVKSVQEGAHAVKSSGSWLSDSKILSACLSGTLAGQSVTRTMGVLVAFGKTEVAAVGAKRY